MRDLKTSQKSLLSAKKKKDPKKQRKGNINQFVPNGPFLYPPPPGLPLETENLTVFWCFQEVEKGALGKKGLKLN